MSEIVIERIRETLGKKNIGGFFISRPVNVKYVSGYTGEDSLSADHGGSQIFYHRSPLYRAGIL